MDSDDEIVEVIQQIQPENDLIVQPTDPISELNIQQQESDSHTDANNGIEKQQQKRRRKRLSTEEQYGKSFVAQHFFLFFRVLSA